MKRLSASAATLCVMYPTCHCRDEARFDGPGSLQICHNLYNRNPLWVMEHHNNDFLANRSMSSNQLRKTARFYADVTIDSNLLKVIA